MQDQAALLDVDVGVPVDGQREPKVLEEPHAEIVHPADAAAELGLQGAPGDWSWLVERMQAVGKPSVQVERDTVIVDGPDRSFFDRDRVLLEEVKKHL